MDEQTIHTQPLEARALHPFRWSGDAGIARGETEQVLEAARQSSDGDRVIATVLFTDIVDATAKLATLGDRKWHALLDLHHALVRRALMSFRGREIDTAGDGFFAAFDSPDLAIHCACAIADTVHKLGIAVRAGLHIGECEVMDKKLGGLTVHICARVVMLACADEVLVSGTMKDLVVGSGFSFQDRGFHSLKGVPGDWHLYAVNRSAP